jgi:hypothetical protein
MQDRQIEELIANSQDSQDSQNSQGNQSETTVAKAANTPKKAENKPENKPEKQNKIFQKYAIKDIVFLAIITACTLVTGAIMPLLVNVPVFGIIQLGLGLQFSVFPVIGMMKVRKPGALLLQSLFISVFLVFMFPPMVFIIACALIAELVVLLFFRGYKKDLACVAAGTLYMPLTIPFLFLYYNAFYTVTGSEKAAVSMFIGGNNAGYIIGISIAVLALCFVGSLIGMVVAKELRKAGKLK